MRVKAVALAFALMTYFVSFAKPADKTVWRVGVFDGSSGEFASGEPHAVVHFVAGQDQPRTAWFAFAPVAWAGKPADSRSAPRAIDFSIAGRPEPGYRLSGPCFSARSFESSNSLSASADRFKRANTRPSKR